MGWTYCVASLQSSSPSSSPVRLRLTVTPTLETLWRMCCHRCRVLGSSIVLRPRELRYWGMTKNAAAVKSFITRCLEPSCLGQSTVDRKTKFYPTLPVGNSARQRMITTNKLHGGFAYIDKSLGASGQSAATGQNMIILGSVSDEAMMEETEGLYSTSQNAAGGPLRPGPTAIRGNTPTASSHGLPEHTQRQLRGLQPSGRTHTSPSGLLG
ncbi:hypothetical protein Pcinc_038075 [Petrolisthes cinctipes]|uniref:Uncharacterized protein n=1 Tax=Petrolisthes cinctipes TaxID=88211 RepID=A0AAE1BR84_PETCI|nr:hypothetical protein Pcinc_038075 [Petrolisthes cinctipes]